MASIDFETGTVIEVAWLVDVNKVVYDPNALVITASSLVNVPAGNIASTTVQAALNELDTDKQAVDADLTAISALASTGMMSRTGSGAYSTRTLTAGFGISIADGDGVAGNPTITNTMNYSKQVALGIVSL